MKRLILAIVLGAAAIGICLLGYVIVDGGVEQISYHIEKAMEACEDGDLESAEIEMEHAIKKWEHSQMGFEFFTGNDIINTVDHSMARMKILLRFKDTEWFVLECREALLSLERIAYAESFSFKNIM